VRVRSVVILVLLLLFLVVVVQNTEVVSVRLLFRDLEMSRIILLALSLAVGVIVGILLGQPWRRQQQYAQAKRPPALAEGRLLPTRWEAEASAPSRQRRLHRATSSPTTRRQRRQRTEPG